MYKNLNLDICMYINGKNSKNIKFDDPYFKYKYINILKLQMSEPDIKNIST